jgi:1,6-anhydro-N-acetylmuramate kinase
MADVAVLGQGAPIVPYLDGILLHRHLQSTGRVGAMVNIGGMSNISAILPGTG